MANDMLNMNTLTADQLLEVHKELFPEHEVHQKPEGTGLSATESLVGFGQGRFTADQVALSLTGQPAANEYVKILEGAGDPQRAYELFQQLVTAYEVV